MSAYGATAEVPFNAWSAPVAVPNPRETARVELDSGRLCAFPKSFDDSRREQRQPQNAPKIGFVDRVCLGEVAESCDLSKYDYKTASSP